MVSWGPEPEPGRLADDPREQVRREIFERPAPRGPRPIVGYVYEAILRDQPPGQHAYVGKCMGSTEAAVSRRFFGPQASAHTSPESIKRDPWKARILPGRKGYRILERIRDTGLGDRENDLAVRRAESFWIDRLRTTFNDVRPVRPPLTETPPPARRSRPAVQRSRRRSRPTRKGPVLLLLLATVTYTAMLGWFIHAMQLPWPIVTWGLPPALGLLFGFRTLARAVKAQRKIGRLLK